MMFFSFACESQGIRGAGMPRSAQSISNVALCTLFGLLLSWQLPAVAHDIRTDGGDPIRHGHPPEVLSPEQKEALEEWVEANFPEAELIDDPTSMYNCFGRAFDRAQSWLDWTGPGEDSTEQIEEILDDNDYATAGQVGRPCCVIIYRGPDGNITHAGLVLEVDGSGAPTIVLSKWGALGLYRHAPDHCPYVPPWAPAGSTWEVWCKP